MNEVAVADIRVFKPGDLVNLKSGGPCMTVLSEPDDDGDVGCVWFVFSAVGTHYVPKDDGSEDEVEHGKWEGPFYGDFPAPTLEHWDE